MDAGAFGARLAPVDAYRLARGEEIESSAGGPVRLARPLDFLVVADHSDNMGFFPDLYAGAPNLLADPTGKRWYDLVQSGEGMTAALEIIDMLFSCDFSRGYFLWAHKQALQRCLGKNDRGGREVQRTGSFHCIHWLRVDFAGAAR